MKEDLVQLLKDVSMWKDIDYGEILTIVNEWYAEDSESVDYFFMALSEVAERLDTVWKDVGSANEESYIFDDEEY